MDSATTDLRRGSVVGGKNKEEHSLPSDSVIVSYPYLETTSGYHNETVVVDPCNRVAFLPLFLEPVAATE